MFHLKEFLDPAISVLTNRCSSRCDSFVSVDEQRTGDKLPRFHEKNLRGLKENPHSIHSAGGRVNCDDANNVSAVPAFPNVLVQYGASYSSDNDAEKYENKKKLGENNGTCGDELRWPPKHFLSRRLYSIKIQCLLSVISTKERYS